MDEHWCVRALLQFLKRKVEYQKFALVPPADIPQNKLKKKVQDDNDLLLKQRARACTTCFLFTDSRANAKLENPSIILVMDFTDVGEVALSIFRHSPLDHNVSKKIFTPFPHSDVNEDDIEALSLKFKSLSLRDKTNTQKPQLTLLVGPIRITSHQSSLTKALKQATQTLADFPQSEFSTIVVIGGKSTSSLSSSENDSFMDDMSSEPSHGTRYDDEVNLPYNYSWNLLILLQKEKGQTKHDQARSRRSLGYLPHKNSGVSLDLDNIPILVHLGGGKYPSACGQLPSGLLTNFAWEDTDDSMGGSGVAISERSIPRSIGFDLDEDAISEKDEEEEGEEDDDDDEEEEMSNGKEEKRKGLISPLIRKRNDNKEDVDESDSIPVLERSEKTVKRDQTGDISSDSSSLWLGSAMKRCRIEEAEDEEIDCEEESGQRRKLQSHSGLMKIRNHGTNRGVRGRDASCFSVGYSQEEEERPCKRLFRGSSFDRVIPTCVNSRPLATVVEGEILEPTQDLPIDNTLSFGLSSQRDHSSPSELLNRNLEMKNEKHARKFKEANKNHFVAAKIEPGFQNSYSEDDIREGTLLRKQASPKRKIYRAPVMRHSPSSSRCILPSLSVPQVSTTATCRGAVSGGGLSPESESPNTSGEAESPNTSGEDTDEDGLSINDTSSTTDITHGSYRPFGGSGAANGSGFVTEAGRQGARNKLPATAAEDTT